MPRLEFTDREATVHKAIVVSLDLTGFSDFCNQPDASTAAPRLTKHFFGLLNRFFAKEDDSLIIKTVEPGKLPAPDFIKFTGDGALMFWIRKKTSIFPKTSAIWLLRQCAISSINFLSNCPNECGSVLLPGLCMP
jgi:hypothetical protein